jgi:hypothetical protein
MEQLLYGNTIKIRKYGFPCRSRWNSMNTMYLLKVVKCESYEVCFEPFWSEYKRSLHGQATSTYRCSRDLYSSGSSSHQQPTQVWWHYLHLYFFTVSTAPFGPGLWFFSFMIILQTLGLLGQSISLSQGLCLNRGRHKQILNAYTHQTSMPYVGFEPMIPASDRRQYMP